MDEYESLEISLRKKVDNIKHLTQFGSKLRLNSFIHEDENDDEEEYNARDGEAAGKYTQLRPNNRGRGGYRGGRGRGGNRGRRDDRDYQEYGQNSNRGNRRNSGRRGGGGSAALYKADSDNFPTF